MENQKIDDQEINNYKLKTNNKIQTVTFSLKDQLYGINICTLDEIIPMIAIKSLLEGPSFLEGIINLRGEVVPIVDLIKQFGLERKDYTKQSRIIIASFHGRKIGFIVEGVKDIIEIQNNNIQPSVVSSEHSDFIEGIVKLDDERMVHLISIDKLLKEEDLNQLSAIKIEE